MTLGKCSTLLLRIAHRISLISSQLEGTQSSYVLKGSLINRGCSTSTDKQKTPEEDPFGQGANPRRPYFRRYGYHYRLYRGGKHILL